MGIRCGQASALWGGVSYPGRGSIARGCRRPRRGKGVCAFGITKGHPHGSALKIISLGAFQRHVSGVKRGSLNLQALSPSNFHLQLLETKALSEEHVIRYTGSYDPLSRGHRQWRTRKEDVSGAQTLHGDFSAGAQPGLYKGISPRVLHEYQTRKVTFIEIRKCEILYTCHFANDAKSICDHSGREVQGCQ